MMSVKSILVITIKIIFHCSFQQNKAPLGRYLPHLLPATKLSAPPHFESGVSAPGFDRWIEQFEERDRIAGWNNDQQLHQLKLLLDKMALNVFRMLPDCE